MDATETPRRRRTSSWRRMRDMQQRNPLRPLDWQWRLACELVERDVAAPPRHEDRTLHDAVRFRRQLERAQTSAQYHDACDQSAVGKAYEVFAGSDDLRNSLESRLLTGELLGRHCQPSRLAAGSGSGVRVAVLCRSRSPASPRFHRQDELSVGCLAATHPKRLHHEGVCLLWRSSNSRPDIAGNRRGECSADRGRIRYERRTTQADGSPGNRSHDLAANPPLSC